MSVQIILSTLLLSTFLISNSLAQEMPLVYHVENTGADCPMPPLPAIEELPSIRSLPDPFMWSDVSRHKKSGKL